MTQIGDAGPHVEIVPLGGAGEFGLHMTAFTCVETTIVVDAGVMFPEPDLLGVDLIVPDTSYLEQLPRRPAALVLTHGHEDHIGAVAYVLSTIDGPIYGTALTLALLEPKLKEHGWDVADRLTIIAPGDIVSVGPFKIEFISVTHSIPDSVALAIHSPAGVVVHTGDFKIDQTPIDGQHFDVNRLAELGSAGVLALLADSTNIERRGWTGSEVEVVGAFEDILSSTKGKVVVTTFTSSLHRIQLLVNAAVNFERQVAFLGPSMVKNVEIAERLGHVRIPAGVRIRETDVMNHAPEEILCVATGSQGQPGSAISRMAVDDHRHVKLQPDDIVVFSARAIPGNERAIGRVMDHVARRGVDTVHDGLKHVHVSGHASEEELKLIVALVRPRFFIPIHGEYRQLVRFGRVAERVSPGTTTVLAETGDRLVINQRAATIVGKAPSGRVLLDGTRTGSVGDEVLRDRRRLAGDGAVIPVLAIERSTGALIGVCDVIHKGLASDGLIDDLLKETALVIQELVASSSPEEKSDPGLFREKIRTHLQRLYRRRSGRRPLVIPVIMEM